MKVGDFIRALLPSIEKNEMLADCRMVIQELKTDTIPELKAGEKAFQGFNFKSEQYDFFKEAYKRHTMGSKAGKLLPDIADAAEMAEKNMEMAEKLIYEHFADTSELGGLTARKANLIRVLEAGSFFSKYARKWLIYVYTLETAQYENSGIDNIDYCVTKADAAWLIDNFLNFIVVMKCLSNEPNENHKRLIAIPDIVITPENAETVEAQFGTEVDPLNMGFIPVWLNPIYHVRMRIAEWQTARYHSAKEEVRLMQLRRMNIEKLIDGKPDAKLQKEIEYLENRINEYNFKIEKMEKEHA